MPRTLRWKKLAALCCLVLEYQMSGQLPAPFKKDSMRIDLDQFSLEIPEGFSDDTNYTFKEPREQEELTTTFGSRSPDVRDPEAMMAIRRSNLEISFPGVVKIEGERDSRIDGLPARLLSFSYSDQNTGFRESWAVALPSKQEYMQISYMALAGDSQAAQRFQYILQSVVPARRAPSGKTRPGYVRRWAGRMSLDVPITLSPPPVYVFSRPDGALKFILSYYNPKKPSPDTWKEFQQAAASEGTEMGIGGKTTESVDAPSARATIICYTVGAQQTGTKTLEAVRQANVMMGNGINIHISGRAPVSSADQVDSMLKAIIKSLQSNQ